MDAETKSCEERIDEQMRARLTQFCPDFQAMDLAQLREYVADYGGEVPDDPDDADAWREAAREAAARQATESVLSVERHTVYRVCLSWGGPADYFEIIYDDEKEIVGGAYLFQDWFDGARRSLSAEQAEELAATLGVYPE